MIIMQIEERLLVNHIKGQIGKYSFEINVILHNVGKPNLVLSCLIIQSKINTVEPQLSGILDYLDFFSGPNFVMNIYELVMIKIRSHILFKTTELKNEVKASLFNFQKAK